MSIDPLAHAVPHPTRLLEVSHVAHRLSTNPRFVWRLIRERRLPAFRLGTRWRIDEADLLAYIAACKAAHKNASDDRAPGREQTPAIIFKHPSGAA